MQSLRAGSSSCALPTSPSDSRRTHLTRLRTTTHSFKMPSCHGPGPANSMRSLSPWSSASTEWTSVPSMIFEPGFPRTPPKPMYRYSYSVRTSCMTVSLRLSHRDRNDLFSFLNLQPHIVHLQKCRKLPKAKRVYCRGSMQCGSGHRWRNVIRLTGLCSFLLRLCLLSSHASSRCYKFLAWHVSTRCPIGVRAP